MGKKNGFDIKMDLPEKWIWQKNGFARKMARKMDLPEKWIWQKNGFDRKMDLPEK
jgi:hypothetical protein